MWVLEKFIVLKNGFEDDEEVFEGGEIKEEPRTPIKKKEVDESPQKSRGKDSSAKKKEEKELTPEEKEAKKIKDELSKKMAKTILWGYVKKFWGLLTLGLGLNFFGMVGEFANPLFIGWVIDLIVLKDLEGVKNLVTLWMLVNGTGAIMTGIQRVVFDTTSQKIGQQLRQDVFNEIVNKDIAFFDQRRTGDLISRLSADTAKIELAISSQFALFVKSSIYCITVLVMFFIISWKMTLFTVGIMIPIIPVFPVWGRFRKNIEVQLSDAKAAASNVAEEAFSNIRTVKAFATEQEETMDYQEKNNTVYELGLKNAFYYGMFTFFLQFLQFGSLDALVWFAAYLNDQDGLTVGEFTSFQFYMFSFIINFGAIGNVLGEVMGVIGTTTAIADIFVYKQKILTTGGDAVKQESLDIGTITLENIEFTYPTKQEVKVINKVEIVVGKNKTIALVGSSGCGKSTIIQLVERFYDPDVGSVTYGTQNLKTLNPIDFKSNMAIVQQEPVLFSGTIRENIVYGLDKEPTEQELDECCKKANAYDFISDKKTFPKGYETVVGERGIKLSGGQKQRVAISRALVRKPKILLLDEATSALDADSEHQVQQALDDVLKNPELTQTVIVIAHRLSTIKDADEILCLNKGVIVERGTHEELIEMNGQYKALVERQLMTTDVSN